VLYNRDEKVRDIKTANSGKRDVDFKVKHSEGTCFCNNWRRFASDGAESAIALNL